MAERGRKANKRATASKRKKPASRTGSGKTTSIKPKSGKRESGERKSPKAISSKASVPKSFNPKSFNPKSVNPKSENARLKSELRTARDRQAASAEVMRLISASPGDADQTLRRIAEVTERLFGASSVSLLIADGEQWGRTIRVGAGSEQIAAAIPLAHVKITSKFMPGAVYLENRQVHVSNADDPAEIARWPGMVPARAAGTRTMSGTPLRREGKAIGAFIVHRDRPVPFTQDELALLQTFADQAVIVVENVRLFDEVKARTHDLQESLRYQTATSDVLQVISRSTFDVQTVLDTLVESAYKLCGANLGLLYLRGDEAFECRAVAGVGVAEASLLFKGRPIRAGRGTAAERVIMTGEVESINDFSKDPEMDSGIREVIQNAAALSIGQIRSTLAVPMKRDNTVIGVMVIACSQIGPFPPRQIELLRTFASQAVIAIQNARLFNETREALERQTATSEVLQVISRSPGELEPVFQTILASATHICDAQFGLLLLCENDGLRCKSVFNLPPAFAETFSRNPVIYPPPIDPLGRLIATRQVVHVKDVTQEPAYLEGFPPIIELVHLGGARTNLLVPMLKDNSIAGVIAIFRQTVHEFSDKQIDLITSFASQAVIAIENARLLNETREALERQIATSEVLQVISRSPGDLEPVFQTILASANRICDAQFGQLFVHENNGFRCTSVLNLPPAFAETFSRNPLITPPPIDPLGRLIATRQVVHVKDVTQEPAYLEGFPPIVELVHLGGARTILLVPMLKENSVAGVIAIFRQTVHEFSDKQIDLITSFASQAVIAIENARLLNETREALERQTATADILKVIASSPDDVQPVFQAIAERSNRLVNGLSTTVLSIVDDIVHLSAFTPTNPDADAALNAYFPRPLSASPFGEANRRGEVYRLSDTETEPTLREIARLRGYRSMLFVPLLHDGKPIGMIGQTKTEPGPFGENHVQLLKTFADQAVIAIENVRLFEQVQARTKELSLSLEDLRTAQDRLVQTEKLASLGQLTAGIAHEIKNPLNFVNNFSSLSAELIDELNDALKPAALDDKVREEIDELTQMLKGNLEKVVQHGKRADSIVKNMLVHSREGSGEHRLADINAIVEESLNLAYHGARAEKSGFNITLQRDLDPAAGMIDLYPQEITRVFLNLISNGFYAAAKRKEAGGEGFEPTLRATTKNLGSKVEIRIRDNGTGIPADVKEKMFNPFFTTKPAGEGTGLGLSMSHDIVVKQHGGKIDVDTMPGAFTEFIITLPRTA